MKKKYPKYPNGGEFGNALRNYGLAGVDATLSTFGADKVIKDSDYRGNSAQDFAKAGNIMGGITKTAAPMVANIVAPGSGSMVSAGQNIGAQFNPQDPNAQQYPQQSQSQGVNPNQMMGMAQTGMQIYNMGSQMGAFRNGGMQYCANGGMINAEVEKQENTLNPDGTTTQFDGPSHEGGGIKTHLDPTTMVFSDRLKMNGKTFAKLNKVNATTKEDKILENDKATAVERLTAELMKNVKNKNSERLFNDQESLKQSKMEKYAKRIGMSTEGKYPDGGYVGWAKERQTAGWKPLPANYPGNVPGKEQYYDPKYNVGIDPQTGTFNALPETAIQGYQAPVNKATFDTRVPKTAVIDTGRKPVFTGNPNYQTYQYADANGQYGNATTKHFDAKTGQEIDLSKAFDESGTYRPTFSKGGMMRYDDGGFGPNIEPDQLPMINTPMNNTPLVYNQGEEVQLRGNADMVDFDRNAYLGDTKSDNNQNNNVPWGNIAKQIGLGVANNAGNIYDLKRANKVENTKFQQATPSLLDPTAALNYNMVQGRKLNEDIRNSSGGNASNYIQNRKDAAINQMMSNAQIRQSYANQNAQINNNMGMFNTGIANQEVVANEQNRAASRNMKSNAISNIGQNIMGQYKDTKLDSRDQDMLDIIDKQYPDARYNPALKDYYTKRKAR